MQTRASRFRSLSGLLVLAVLATGCESPVATPVIPDPSEAPGPPAGFNVVMVRQGGGPPAGSPAPVVNNLADALDKVADGGTIKVAAGTYEASWLRVDKAVTIEAAGGARPVIHVPAASPGGFLVAQVQSGTVAFRGLDFDVDGWAGIRAQMEYDQVEVEDVSFDLAGVTGVFASLSSVPGARVLVENSSFTGGGSGVFASQAPNMVVQNSAFSDHWHSGIQLQAGSSGLIRNNEVTRCGPGGCIRIHQPAGVDVVGNTVTNEAPHPVSVGIIAFAGGSDVLIEDNDVVGVSGAGEPAFGAGIQVEGVTGGRVVGNRVSRATNGIAVFRAAGAVTGNVVEPCGANSCISVSETVGPVEVSGNTLRGHSEFGTFFGVISITRDGQSPVSVTDNVIEGVGTPANPADPAGWPLEIAFQHNSWNPGEGGTRGPAADFSGNQVRNVAVGVRAFHGGVVEGTDNTFETLYGEVLGAHDHAINRIQRSDATGYQGDPLAVSASGVLEATCNWWGSAAGPQGWLGGVPASAYTPWADEPIAGNAGVACP